MIGAETSFATTTCILAYVADGQAAVRRDYELALQLATRDGWEAFLSQYPAGFYASLAKGQLNKIGAEAARALAVEKARLAEQERARLAQQGAREAELSKAVASAKVAEEARIAAEEATRVAQEKTAAAENTRLAEQEKAGIEKEGKVAGDLIFLDHANLQPISKALYDSQFAIVQ